MNLDSTGCRIPPNGEYLIDKVKRLEKENQALKEQIEELEWELKTSIEAQRCECGFDDMCRFARERDEATTLLRRAVHVIDDWFGSEELQEINKYLERR